MDTLDRLSRFAAKQESIVERSYRAEQQLIQQAIKSAGREQDKALLEDAALSDEETQLERRHSLNALWSFVNTFKQATGSQTFAASCQQLICGRHAFCQPSPSGASCRCQDGYQGNGYVCNPPSVFIEHPLIQAAPRAPQRQIADLNIIGLRGNGIAIAFRDVAQQNQGYLMLGHASPSGLSLGAPILFSNKSRAFGPALAELENGEGLVIAFRDENRGGSGFVISATLTKQNSSGDARPSYQVAFSQRKAFARRLAQGMVLLPLATSHVAVVFAEHALEGAGGMFGSAVVARIPGKEAAPELAGKYRFVSGPIARLSATALSPESFIIAFRRASGLADTHIGEAACVHVRTKGYELMFSPTPFALEPERGQIWARSVAPLSETSFAYTYHSGHEQLTKQAIIRVEPLTHEMTVVREPEIIGRGFTPYVGMLSTAVARAGHHTMEHLEMLRKQGPRMFTFLSDRNTTNAQAHMCRVSEGAGLDSCRHLMWSSHELLSISGTAISDGRLLLVFTDARGAPSYQFIGLQEAT